MTPRFLILALVLTAPLAAGCKGTGGSTGGADLDGIAEADPFDQLAYNAGYESARQLLQQDSTFSFDRFEAGFRAGLDGDSTEIAYALGLRYGLQLRADTISNINPEVFLSAIREGLTRDSSRLTPEQVTKAQSVVEDSLTFRQLRAQARTDPQAQQRLNQIRRNQVTADSFLAAAGKLPGVQRTESGLLYQVKETGQGASPTDANQVKVEYEGRLPNGETFDKSPPGEPAVFSVNQVVPGFAEALKGMKPGESRTVYLPPKLAYGIQGIQDPSGQGGIPPNAALEFDVKLLEVLPPAPAPQGFPPGMIPGQ